MNKLAEGSGRPPGAGRGREDGRGAAWYREDTTRMQDHMSVEIDVVRS